MWQKIKLQIVLSTDLWYWPKLLSWGVASDTEVAAVDRGPATAATSRLKLRSCFWGALKVTSPFLKEVILWNWKCKLSHLLLPLRCSEISPISFSISTAISTKTMCLTWEKSCKMLGKESQLAGMFFLSLPEPPKSDGGGQTTSRDLRRWQHSGIHQDRCRLLKSRLPF